MQGTQDDRLDINNLFNFYYQQSLHQTPEETKDLSKCKENNYECTIEPLLNIPLTNVIADELQLLLRITDKRLQKFLKGMQRRILTRNGEHPKEYNPQRLLVVSVLLGFPFLFGVKLRKLQVCLALKKRNCLMDYLLQ